jgi:tetratricopeptide (TPR) repeat protein
VLLLAAVAFAEEGARAWETLYDTRLVEAADNTPEVAVAYYEDLLREMPAGDPVAGAAWYGLGRARWAQGDEEGAAAALKEALKDAATRDSASALLARIEMRQHRVLALPVKFGFQDGTGGFVRAGEHADRGSLAVGKIGGASVLWWTTEARAEEADRIAIEVDAGAPLQAVAFRLRGSRAAELLVVLEDGSGGRSVAEVPIVPVGEWASVELPMSAFRGPVTGRTVRVVAVEDVTAATGATTLLFDDFVLR